VPGAAANVTTTSASLAVIVTFARPANSAWVSVYRATGPNGEGAIVLEPRVDATRWIDSMANVPNVAGTVFYYKIRGENAAGQGPLSPNWIAGTVGAYDGSNLAVNTLQGNRIIAGSLHGDRLTAGTVKADKLDISSQGGKNHLVNPSFELPADLPGEVARNWRITPAVPQRAHDLPGAIDRHRPRPRSVYLVTAIDVFGTGGLTDVAQDVTGLAIGQSYTFSVHWQSTVSGAPGFPDSTLQAFVFFLDAAGSLIRADGGNLATMGDWQSGRLHCVTGACRPGRPPRAR
jgi:hypothetical protein